VFLLGIETARTEPAEADYIDRNLCGTFAPNPAL